LNNQATTTYTFTPTAGQCANTTTLTIAVNPTIVPTFAAVNAICQGNVLTALPTSSINAITGTWSPALNNQATTTYTFTPSAGQCANTTTLTIAVNPTIVPTFNAVSPICQGGTLSALPTSSLNGITGTWSPALNNQATTTYTFTPTTGQCATTTTLTITVNPTIVPTFAAVNAICQGGNLSALPTTSLNGITGIWSPALNNQATTTYTFTPATGQCASTATLTITVNPTIVPTFAAVNAICQGGNLSALPTTSLNAIMGIWSPALNNQATTTYTFTPTVGQCSTTATLTIAVNAQVTPSFAAVSPICQGGNLSALPTTSLNAIMGIWSPALNNQATTTYTFTPTLGQCATTTNLTIAVNAQVTPSFAAVSPICQGGNLSALPTTSLNAITGIWSPALNNQATTTYTFTPTVGQCATTTNLTIAVNAQVTPTFAAVSPICQGGNLSALPTTSLNGITGIWSPALNNQATTTYTFAPTVGQCATTTTLTITVNPTIVPTFAAVNAICQGDVLTALPTSSINAITGTWSPALNNQATTTYTFTPTAGQCATTTTLTITVNPTIVPTFAAVNAVCQGDVLTALPTSSVNTIAGTWSPALNNQATTTYTFTPTAGQCATTTTLTITVNPTIVPTFAAVNAICQGGNLSALPTTSLNGITGTWSPALNNQATTTYTFTPTTGQCATTTTLTITVNPTIVPTFAAVNAVCQGDVLTALPTSSVNGITGTWSPALNNQATTTYTFTPSSGTCTSTASMTISIIDQPMAQFSVSPPDSILIGSTLYFQNGSVNATAYIWQINNQEFSSDVNPSFLTNDEEYLVFTLIALNQTCTDTFEVQVPLIESSFVFASNCFTPDADEFNPTWKPIISENYDQSNYQLTIYNRWGEVIWESFDYHEAWDGTYGAGGQDVQDGVYTWVLRLKKKKNDEVSIFSGTLLRIR
jgi:gliding motility-associated-like protein